MKTAADESEKIQNPHDAAVKAAFKKKKVAIAFFKQYLPKEIAARIDFQTLKVLNASYVDEKLKSRHSDIVYQVRMRNQIAFLYILFEHQSTPDYWIAFRLLCYKTDIWREYREQNPQAKKLPVILPVVFYHGKQKWTAPRSFEDLFTNGDGLKRFIPQFMYSLHDLSEYEDQRIFLGQEMTLNLILYLFKHIHDKDFAERFAEAMKYLARFQDEQTQLEFLEWVLRYTYSARDDEQTVIDRGMEVLGKEAARRMAMTIAERLRQEGRREGRQEGRQEGREEGREEGIEEGARRTIVKMMKRRFPDLPFSMEQEILQADADLMEKFGESLFDFSSLKDVEHWWSANAGRTIGK